MRLTILCFTQNYEARAVGISFSSSVKLSYKNISIRATRPGPKESVGNLTLGAYKTSVPAQRV